MSKPDCQLCKAAGKKGKAAYRVDISGRAEVDLCAKHEQNLTQTNEKIAIIFDYYNF